MTSAGPVVPSLFILMEFANGGNVADLIAERIKAGSCLDEDEEIWPFLIDIVLGIRHLHRAGIIHRYNTRSRVDCSLLWLLHAGEASCDIRYLSPCCRDLKLENLLLHTERDEPDETSMSTIPVSADAMDDASSGGRKRKLAGDSRPRVLITDFGQSENARRFLREPRTGTARCWCRVLIARPGCV